MHIYHNTMIENRKEQTLLLLKKSFPEFEKKLDAIFGQDPLFREIAKEYYEIVKKMETNYVETGIRFDFYISTTNELKQELLDYLNDLKSNNYRIDEH